MKILFKALIVLILSGGVVATVVARPCGSVCYERVVYRQAVEVVPVCDACCCQRPIIIERVRPVRIYRRRYCRPIRRYYRPSFAAGFSFSVGF